MKNASDSDNQQVLENKEPKIEQFKHIRIPNDNNESDVKINNIDTEGCITHTMSAKNDSSLIHTQNISNDILKHTSDDPSAPTYPPRSPTSDIVPSELPSCHIISATSKDNKGNENIYQVDGSAENPETGDLSSLILPDRRDPDIMVLLDESNQLSKNISHSSSSSSVSSNGSRASSSVRESMSDTVSIQSSISSGYGSESFENYPDQDKGTKELFNYTHNNLYKSDNCHYPTYIEKRVKYFDSSVFQNFAKPKDFKESNCFNTLVSYVPSQSGVLQQFPDVYEYHNGNLILVTKGAQHNNYAQKIDINANATHNFSISGGIGALIRPQEDVLAIQNLLQNVEINKK